MQSSSLKRQRSEDDDGEMDVSSRSPSPAPPDNEMDVDDEDFEEERITVETRLKSSNKGFAMLAKLGWNEGQPLGLSDDARVDPIPFSLKSDVTGVGKTTQDVQMVETTVAQRRELESERMSRETAEQRRIRLDDAARRFAIASEVSDVLRAFYCALCDKQFKNVAQYDEHTNSYAHHHKARARDMQASLRLKPQEEVDKRKEKERKREEKELRKIAAANGIKVPKVALPTAVTPAAPAPAPALAVTPLVPATSGFKKVGWSTVTSEPPAEAPTPATPPVVVPATVQPTVNAQPLDAPARPSKAHTSRMGWQQFQKSNNRRA